MFGFKWVNLCRYVEAVVAGEQVMLRAACDEADALRAELSALKASSAKSFAEAAADAVKKIKGLEIEVKRLEALADGSAVGLCTLNQVDP